MTRGDWKKGEPVNHPVEDMVALDFLKLDTRSKYKLLVGAIVPRPIALVSTVDGDGATNLAPFSFFNGVSTEPPCLMFSAAFKPDGRSKDTLNNIRQNGEFVVHTVSDWLAEPANHASANYGPEVSEIEETGLTPVPSICVKPPRIKESPVHFECRLEQLVQVGEPQNGASTVVIGRILMMHVYSEAFQDGRIIAERLQPVARMGGLSYAQITKTFDLDRPKIE